MTHRERILAAIAGEPVDHVPIALWRHFPVADQTAEGLAAAVTGFQREYDFDLVKVTHASGYPAEAWGAELEDAENPEGTRRYLKRPVRRPADWRALPQLAPTDGVLARELDALQLVRANVGTQVPVLPTIFSPLTIAKQLAGERAMLTHLRENPTDLEAGLRTVADATARFVEECARNGADAFFFATQFARRDKLTDEEYRRFGVPFDKIVIEAARAAGDFLLLHLHGDTPMFELASDYEADIVNWHDRETAPSLAEGLQDLDKGAVLGGVARETPLAHGSPEAVADQVRDAMLRTGGRRLIVGAGCVALVDTPPANIRAACDGARAPAPS